MFLWSYKYTEKLCGENSAYYVVRRPRAVSDFYCDEALSGKTPIITVLETDDVLAFHHTKPYWPVHIVVVPKKHVPSLTDLGEESIDLVYKVLDVVREVAAKIEMDHGACRVFSNLGKYQDSKHLHFHVASGESYGRNVDA